jgi:hypothetical protein
MLLPSLLASLAFCQPAAQLYAPAMHEVTAADSTLQRTFDRGLTFATFLERAQARREGWLQVQRDAAVSSQLITRARAVGGRWQWLVVARDACGDSMNSVPYAARLTDSVPGMTLRIVHPDQGSAIQRAHQTQDGRNATPTFVLLDSQGNDVGCLVELPQPLRTWTDKHRGKVDSDSLHEYRNAFYRKDAGVSLVTELVEIMEAAKAGTPVCDRRYVVR